MALSPTTMLTRGSRHVETDVGDQTMMMSVHTGKYYALEGTAKSIWSHLITPKTIEDLVASLVAEFDVDPEKCLADVLPFLDDMVEHELVVATDPNTGA